MGLLEALLAQSQAPDQPSPLATIAPSGDGAASLPQVAQQQADTTGMAPTVANQKTRGMLKQMLTRFAYGFGQGMTHSAGLPTDMDLANSQVQRNLAAAQTAHAQASADQVKAQTAAMGTMVTVQTPNGIMQVPYGLAKDALGKSIAGQYGVSKEDLAAEVAKQVAQIKADSAASVAATNKRYLTTPQGLYDTQTPDANGFPTLIPNSGAGIPVTKEIADQYGIPADYIGKSVKLTDLAAMERGNAMQNGFVMGANGPVAANKVTGVATPVTVDGKGIGNPGVAVAQAGAAAKANWTPFQTADGRTISNAEALRTGAQGSANPLVRKGMEAYLPAYDADARLKQMIQQSQDQTGASDMALLFNHIAMTGGNVKGLRMGEQLTREHMKARGIPEELGVLWNHAASGQSLSPQQRENFVKLGIEVRNSRWQQAGNEARAFGVQGAPESDADLPPLATDGGITQPISDYVGPTAKKSGTGIPSRVQRGMNASQQNIGMVRMRAPNGQVSPVPASQVEHYKSLGAQVVQ